MDGALLSQEPLRDARNVPVLHAALRSAPLSRVARAGECHSGRRAPTSGSRLWARAHHALPVRSREPALLDRGGSQLLPALDWTPFRGAEFLVLRMRRCLDAAAVQG